MIRVICAGYVDAQGQAVPCGKLLGTLMDSRDGIQDGQCQDCSDKATGGKPDYIKQQCAYCQRVRIMPAIHDDFMANLWTAPQEFDHTISHGICLACYVVQLAKIKATA